MLVCSFFCLCLRGMMFSKLPLVMLLVAFVCSGVPARHLHRLLCRTNRFAKHEQRPCSTLGRPHSPPYSTLPGSFPAPPTKCGATAQLHTSKPYLGGGRGSHVCRASFDPMAMPKPAIEVWNQALFPHFAGGAGEEPGSVECDGP